MPSILATQFYSPNREIDSLKLQLAAELAPTRWKNALTRFSKFIHDGNIWIDSVNGAKPSRDLKNLLLAVSYCPDPIVSLCEFLRAKRSHKTFAQTLQPLIYPALLLVATFVVTSGMAWIGATITAGFEWIDWRTGRTDNLISQLFQSQWIRAVATAALTLWLVLVAFILHFLGSPLTRLSLAIEMPILGKLVRWSMFRDLLHTFSVFLASGITAEQAALASAECYRGSLLAIPARGLGHRIQAGQSIEQAIRNSVLCDEFLGPAAWSLLRSEEQTSSGLQSLSVLANQLFEQRQSALSQVANRVALLLVLCMYMRIFVDVVLALQSIDGGLFQFELLGASENWFLLLPLAVVNFVFLNSMFHLKSGGANSGISSVIKLFAGTCLTIALIGLALRLTIADLLYLVPLTMAVMAMRANKRSVNRFAATSALMFGANRPGMPEWIAKNLIDENSGQVRRRVRKFSGLMEKGVPFETAITRSRLVLDHHERWLVALVTRFDNMPESKSILSLRSPWSESSIRLFQRLNALKWMLFVFFFSVLLEVALMWLMWPRFSLMTEFGVSESGAYRILNKNLSFTLRLSEFIFLEMVDPWTSDWGILILCIPFFPLLFVLLLNFLPVLKRRLVDLFMAPVHRAWTLRGISEILKSDSRLVHVLKESSHIHPLRSHRSKLAWLAKNIEDGVSIQNAFARSGMIRHSQRGLLVLAKEPSQLAWSLGQIADRNFFRWMEWYSMCIDVIALLLVLLTATFVGAFAYVQFHDLARIILNGA